MKFKLLVTGIYIKWEKKEQRIVDHHFFLFNYAIKMSTVRKIVSKN